jgi:lambda family phage portal protein
VFGRLRSWLGLGGGGPPAAATSARPQIRARYDNADTNPDNQRHWWAADYLSAKAANSYSVRRTLRTRSRHEVSNNPYLFGVANSNADDLIDTGPTLQVYTPDAAYNRDVERCWREWCAEVRLTEKLRTAKLAKTVDGEGFLVNKTVEDLEHPVKLYPCDVEADQVTTPAPQSVGELWVDGLTLHPLTGRPTHYHVLRQHPGDWYFPTLNPMAVDKLLARHVVHWFGKFRPGQVRGVPVFTPSLDLFTELRAYRRAVVGAAEIAADYAGVMEQDRETGAYDTEDDGDAEFEPFKRVPLSRKSLTVLPPGAKLNQLDAKQPTTGYEQFQEKCLGEACRPLNYPLNLALGTSQKFNFSSAKLDHINYRSSLLIEREECNTVVLEPTFAEWFAEAVLCGAVRPYDGLKLPPHAWHWPGFEPLDPVADAQADHERLSNGSETWQRFWARRGLDWRDVLRQQAAEQREIDRLGLQFGEPATKTISESTTTDGDVPAAARARANMRRVRQLVAMAARICAVKDDNGQEHAEDGKFGTGSGGGSDKGGSDKEKGAEKDEGAAGDSDEDTLNKWAGEDADRDTARQKEDDKVERAREKIDEADTKARDKEDDAFDKREEAIDKSREKVEKAREREDDARESARAKEDKAAEKASVKEEADLDRAHAAEDRAVEKARPAEDKAIEKAREKDAAAREKAREQEDADLDAAEEQERADKEIDKKQQEMFDRQQAEEDTLLEEQKAEHDALKEEVLEQVKSGDLDPPAAQEQIDRQRRDHETALRELREEHTEQEDAFAEENKTDAEKRREEVEREREDEDAAREERESDEDSDREAAREKEDEDRDARQIAERAALEEKWEADDAARDEAREKEDGERDERRGEEDDEHEEAVTKLQQERDAADARRSAEDREWRAKWAREDTETQSARDAEDHELYHERRKEHGPSHEEHYKPVKMFDTTTEDGHAKYGGRKRAEGSRGGPTHAR